jgi:thioredoxin 1
VVELNEKGFDEATRDGVALVDFWAPWCGPCRMQTSILETLSAKISGKAKIAKVNVDDEPGLAAKFGVRSIPTLLLFKNGKVVRQFVGVQQESTLAAAIESA